MWEAMVAEFASADRWRAASRERWQRQTRQPEFEPTRGDGDDNGDGKGDGVGNGDANANGDVGSPIAKIGDWFGGLFGIGSRAQAVEPPAQATAPSGADDGSRDATGLGSRSAEARGSSPSPALGDDAEEEEKEKEEEEEEGAVEQAEEEGRGGGGGEDGGTPHSDSEEEEEAVAAVLDEGIAQLREDKALERNRAVRRILAPSTKTLKDALGLREVTSNKEMAARIRKLLRLLHPDFAINLALKGTEEHERIDAAFKKLNNLRL